MMSTNGGQAPPLHQTLTRQGSLYNLTLDEVQNHLGNAGKPLASMNLEEFLKTITSAEENLDALDPSQMFAPSALPGVQRQPSLVLNQDLGQKTVDDVWRKIQQEQGRINQEEEMVQRQPTLGEMTLEDFLFRTGAMSQIPDQSFGPPLMSVMNVDALSAPQQDWVQYELGNAAGAIASSSSSHPEQNLKGVYVPGFGVGGSNPVLDVGYVENPLVASSPIMAMPVDSQIVDRKRMASDELRNKAIDRRQKRMIKNRESAARSRARKQAYTTQLEGEVHQLKMANTMLKNEKKLQKRSEMTAALMLLDGDDNNLIPPDNGDKDDDGVEWYNDVN